MERAEIRISATRIVPSTTRFAFSKPMSSPFGLICRGVHRIFERLGDEQGCGGSQVTVRRYVRQKRRHSAEVFVPLSHPPGEAQFFGERTVEIAGIRMKAALAVMTLPHSDAFHISATRASTPRPSRPPIALL